MIHYTCTFCSVLHAYTMWGLTHSSPELLCSLFGKHSFCQMHLDQCKIQNRSTMCEQGLVTISWKCQWKLRCEWDLLSLGDGKFGFCTLKCKNSDKSHLWLQSKSDSKAWGFTLPWWSSCWLYVTITTSAPQSTTTLSRQGRRVNQKKIHS